MLTSTPTRRRRRRLPIRRRLLRRVAQLYVGLALYGTSGALQVRASLGLDPWDVLHQGIARRVGLEIGTVVVLVGAAVLLFWIPLRQRPGLGTVSNVVLVGVTMNGALAVLPAGAAPGWRAVELVSGVVLCGAATGMYIGAAFGAGPRDGLMTGLARRTGRSIRLVRTGLEAGVLLVGWLLGGQVGVGTVLFALTIGPLAQLFIRVFALPATAGPGPDHRLPTTERPDAVHSSSASSRASQVANRSTAVSNSGCASTKV